MNTLLITTQLVCYGVGIVSASLNIATFMRRRRIKWRRVGSGHAGWAPRQWLIFLKADSVPTSRCEQS